MAMTKEKALEILEKLPKDSGLLEEENYEDTPEIKKWLVDVAETLEFVKSYLKSSTNDSPAGEMTINGEEYFVYKKK